MATQWLTTIKPSFQNEWGALPPKESHQVLEKITLLTHDPTPDAKVKKQLKYLDGKLHRIRCGDYRIFYTFEKPYISLLALRRRDDDTYKDNPEAEFLGGFDPPLPTVAKTPYEQYGTSASQDTPSQGRPFPEPLTADLLTRLRIPTVYHRRLLRLTSQEELLHCPGVDDETLLRLNEYLFEQPLALVLQQPDLVLNDVNDLLRYKEGELLAFLLKLSPEQEKYATWSLRATGPTLVKGGPGTGKSTIALYRVRSLLQQLSANKPGQTRGEEPHVLFTTYTNALVRSSEQLLAQLLGEDASSVRVDTADKIAYDILHELGQVKAIVSQAEIHKALHQAIAETPFEGNKLQQIAQQQTLERIGHEYLLQEISGVLVARQLASLAAYQATPRSGRKLRLSSSQRALMWRIYERWRGLMEASGKETWQQRRTRAEQLVAQTDYYQRFDAVVIDEAQDLDPSLLRLLMHLCKAPNRLFVTADANQSIYGSGFSWSDVHKDLKFQGRTSILHINYRSTYQLGEAAQSYLMYHGTQDLLDDDGSDYHYIHEGPLPDVRSIANRAHEAQLLATFFKQAIVHFRLTIGSCAVLCPSEGAGQGIVAALQQQGIQATYMARRELDLKQPGVKVLTLKSSKGLEFPIVALAGFVGSSYPIIPYNASEEERAELLAQERRNMFVGMTRAMRSLLVITPADNDSPLFQGFEDMYWNTKRKI